MNVLFSNTHSEYTMSVNGSEVVSKVVRILSRTHTNGVTEFKTTISTDLFAVVEQSVYHSDQYCVYLAIVIDSVQYFSNIICEISVEHEGYSVLSSEQFFV